MLIHVPLRFPRLPAAEISLRRPILLESLFGAFRSSLDDFEHTFCQGLIADQCVYLIRIRSCPISAPSFERERRTSRGAVWHIGFALLLLFVAGLFGHEASAR